MRATGSIPESFFPGRQRHESFAAAIKRVLSAAR
jgi:hypothetical protein